MGGKTITIELTEENARVLEIFLQDFMRPTKLRPPNADVEINAFSELYDKLLKAFNEAHAK